MPHAALLDSGCQTAGGIVRWRAEELHGEQEAWLRKKQLEKPQENVEENLDERGRAPVHPLVLPRRPLSWAPSTRKSELRVLPRHRNRMSPLVLPNPWIPTHQNPPRVPARGHDILRELGIAVGQLKGNVSQLDIRTETLLEELPIYRDDVLAISSSLCSPKVHTNIPGRRARMNAVRRILVLAYLVYRNSKKHQPNHIESPSMSGLRST